LNSENIYTVSQVWWHFKFPWTLMSLWFVVVWTHAGCWLGTCYVAQAGLELSVLLWPLECWDCMCVPLAWLWFLLLRKHRIKSFFLKKRKMAKLFSIITDFITLIFTLFSHEFQWLY
jgi:hypothetical protein